MSPLDMGFPAFLKTTNDEEKSGMTEIWVNMLKCYGSGFSNAGCGFDGSMLSLMSSSTMSVQIEIVVY